MALVLDVDAHELHRMALQLDLDRRAMVSAAKKAAVQAARWARVQTARGLSSRLGVPQGAFAKRITAKRRKAGASLFVGLNPLNVVMAKPTKTPKGLRAGRDNFPGAFIGRGKYGGTAGLRRKGESRLPLEAASFDVVSAGTPLIDSDIWPGLNDRFIELYKQELERKAGR